MKKKIKILIVPAGSRMSIPVIKFLKKDKWIKVVSADINKLAAGLYLSDKAYLISPFSREKKFFSDLKKIILKEKIDILIPGLDPLLVKFSKNQSYFQKLRVKVIISPLKTILITRDKWKTYQALKDVIPMPKSFLRKNDVDISFPLFIKPRGGSGSIDVFKTRNKAELEFYFSKIISPIIQDYLEGKEYTVYCLVNMEGRLLFSIVRERLETKAGVSVIGRVVKHKKIEDIALKISKKLKFQGPFFFQVKEKKGIPYVTEINARFGGGMPLSCAAGPNIYLLSVKLFMGKRLTIPKIKRNIYFTRFDNEIYLNPTSIASKVKKL